MDYDYILMTKRLGSRRVMADDYILMTDVVMVSRDGS